MDIRRLTAGDEPAVLALGPLFDEAADDLATRRFLADPGHHLLVAYEHGDPVGFVSGVEMIHPDKGTEMFVYELSVDERHRRRGIGRGLILALVDLARAKGCYGMWVATDGDNLAAMGTYSSAGATDPTQHTVLTWNFDRS